MRIVWNCSYPNFSKIPDLHFAKFCNVVNSQFPLCSSSAAKCCTHNCLSSCHSARSRANLSFWTRLNSLTSCATWSNWGRLWGLQSAPCCLQRREDDDCWLRESQVELKFFARRNLATRTWKIYFACRNKSSSTGGHITEATVIWFQ